MSHSFFSPSKGVMWMECAGALAIAENQQEGASSSYADDGTASHSLASWALETGKDCHEYPADHITVNGKDYPLDEDRQTRVQVYVDDIRRSALGGILWAEHRVDLSKYLGMAVCPTCEGSGKQVGLHNHVTECSTCDGDGEIPQGGTSDAVVILPKTETLIVGDLKDGAGEKVYASYIHEGGIGDGLRFPNHQTGLYALGVLEDVLLLGHKITRIILRIYQPRLNHIDEFEISASDLLGDFASRVVNAARAAGEAMVESSDPAVLDAKGLLTPGLKTCRWCAAVARCPARQRQVQEETRHDFDDETPPPVPVSTEHLARAFKALPLIEQWVRATKSAIWKAVNEGHAVLGPDGQPLKFVEGKEGNRAWDAAELLSGNVEALLVGQLGDKAYEPRKPITAPAAKKLLDKKATRALWNEHFAPLIKRAKGAPVLALGSDTRPAYGKAAASDFENEDIGVEE